MAEENYKALQNDCGAIRRMLISSHKTIKTKKLGFGLSPNMHLYIQMRCWFYPKGEKFCEHN